VIGVHHRQLHAVAAVALGDVVFFHCRTLHAAQGNRSDRVKLSVVHTYHPQSCHPLPGTRSASQPGVPLAG